ncbi:MAPK regulated corepressor interacting protein 2-like [Diachasmimorpha longicaudata]|uniref:MAPK regulated corepressor interacting protein 2-like n=1 Tax=Diachasmimorpha longicaudata TaxID=58733 RepID=UPI0030B90ED9
MYTVSKGPSKIVAKTRRGINQNLERLETLRDLTRKADPVEEEINDDEISRQAPKPVFNVNGRSKLCSTRQQRIQEVITPQHEELIKFVYESWSQVDGNRGRKEIAEQPHEVEGPSSLYYNDGEPNGILQDFKPFDLESWWGKRLFNNITKSL